MDLLLADVLTEESAGAGVGAAAVLGLIAIIKVLVTYILEKKNGKKNGKAGNPGNPNGSTYHITKSEIAARSKTREQVQMMAIESREQTKLLRDMCAHAKRHETHLEETRRALERIERRQEEAAQR